jgi:PAS domain S-box-containing protein
LRPFTQASSSGNELEPISPGRNGEIHTAHVAADYVVVVDQSRRYVEVSSAFSKLLGYSEAELIGRPYDDFTVPGTNDIATILKWFVQSGYMHGIWVFAHRRGTKILVRYEAFIRLDGLYESPMELPGVGA